MAKTKKFISLKTPSKGLTNPKKRTSGMKKKTSIYGKPFISTSPTSALSTGYRSTGAFFPRVSDCRDVHGCPGIRLEGTCAGVSVISNSVSGGYAWRGLTNPAGTSLAGLPIHPRIIFGQGSFMEHISWIFDRFVFKKFIVHYHPVVSASTDGAFSLVYRPRYGPIVDTATGECADFGAAGTYPDHVTTSYWLPAVLDIGGLSTRENHFDCNTSWATENQEKYQGELFVAHLAWPSTGNTLIRGRLEFEYVLEYYDFSPNKAYSIMAKPPPAETDSKSVKPLEKEDTTDSPSAYAARPEDVWVMPVKASGKLPASR